MPSGREEGAELGRQRGREGDSPAVRGVREGEARGVQEVALEARRARAAAVGRVAGDRVAERRHVHADLVRAPGLEADLEQA